MKIVKILLGLVVLVLLLFFSIDNPQQVQVTFHQYTTPKMPLFLILITALMLGFLAASLLHAVTLLRQRRHIQQLHKQLQQQQQTAAPQASQASQEAADATSQPQQAATPTANDAAAPQE